MFNQISEHIYIRPAQHYTDRPNVGLVVGSRGALLFEAGNSAQNAKQLRKELAAGLLPMPTYVAVSHWHWDHSFGMHAWSVPTIAGKETNEMLLTVSGWQWDDESMVQREQSGEDINFCNEMIRREYPDRSDIKVVGADIVFEGELLIDLGGVTCRLIHAKGPHAADSVICYVPQDRFVLLGDSSGKDLYGKPWHFDIEHEEDFLTETAKIPYDADLVKEYLALLDTLDFERCIGGHADMMSKGELYASFE